MLAIGLGEIDADEALALPLKDQDLFSSGGFLASTRGIIADNAVSRILEVRTFREFVTEYEN